MFDARSSFLFHLFFFSIWQYFLSSASSMCLCIELSEPTETGKPEDACEWVFFSLIFFVSLRCNVGTCRHPVHGISFCVSFAAAYCRTLMHYYSKDANIVKWAKLKAEACTYDKRIKSSEAVRSQLKTKCTWTIARSLILSFSLACALFIKKRKYALWVYGLLLLVQKMKWKVNRIESNRMSKSTSARGESKRSTNFMFSFLFNIFFFRFRLKRKVKKSVRRGSLVASIHAVYTCCAVVSATRRSTCSRGVYWPQFQTVYFCWCGSDDGSDRHPHHGWADANQTENSEVRMHENDNRFNRDLRKTHEKKWS